MGSGAIFVVLTLREQDIHMEPGAVPSRTPCSGGCSHAYPFNLHHSVLG